MRDFEELPVGAEAEIGFVQRATDGACDRLDLDLPDGS